MKLVLAVLVAAFVLLQDRLWVSDEWAACSCFNPFQGSYGFETSITCKQNVCCSGRQHGWQECPAGISSIS